MWRSGYFVLVLANLSGSIIFASISDLFRSLTGFYVLYIMTTGAFVIDWIIGSTKGKSDQHDDLYRNFRRLVTTGDAIMALAIIGALDIAAYSSFLSERASRSIGADTTTIIFALIVVFFVPALGTSVILERYGSRTEQIIYQRLRSAIIDQNVVIPPEVAMVFTARQRKPVETREKSMQPGISLHAYPQASEGSGDQQGRKIADFDPTSGAYDQQKILDIQNSFIASIFPDLAEFLDRSPVSVRSYFFFDIIRKFGYQDPQVIARISRM